MDQYTDYYYAQLMSINLDEETIQAKESYKHLADTHGTRVFDYRADNGIFLETLFKEVF